ncbi:carboxypeptidase-like regulatory domain-containing protein [Leptolyngbya sp. AN02str]|uniref:carboxypeptidase-like regulatory domain-containing protein n=1 Tax=Leptolyngbya sp. AN02str TaxID=3423363 RepID=UPI003D31B5D7
MMNGWYIAPATAMGLLALALGIPQRAIAHGIQVSHQITQAVQIEAIYDTGEPMVNAQVAVFAPSDPSQPWLTGQTNDQGNFVFTPDAAQPGSWEVQVRQAGHGQIVSFSTAEDRVAAAATAGSTEEPGFTVLQTSLMMGSVIWGCVGTALFFSRGKR